MSGEGNVANDKNIMPLEAYFLVGPTGSGKTAVAHYIAEKEGWEILSADAMAVYRGMDIGTAKPTSQQRARVRYHGLDWATPDQCFSVWDYRRLALEALHEASARGVRVLVVGGTGLYVKSLTHGLATSAPPSPNRSHWERVWRAEGTWALRRELERRRPDLLAALPDPQNPRRLLRALERAELGADHLAASWHEVPDPAPLAGLRRDPQHLRKIIAERVARMFAGGLLDEVARLQVSYPSWSQTARQAIGYAEALAMLRGECSIEDAIRRTVLRTQQLAKRQATWFRYQARVTWVDVFPGTPVDETAEAVRQIWIRSGPTRILDAPPTKNLERGRGPAEERRRNPS